MVKTVRDVMTPNPVAMSSDTPITQAARAMSDRHIGSVVVMEKDRPLGIVTDRDIAVRAVSKGSDPSVTRLVDICSTDIAAVRPDQSLDDAVRVMKAHDVKRVLVMDHTRLEGIVSIGDLTAHGKAEAVQTDLGRSRPNS